ncbi:Alternative oxidase 1a, mitochondrial [Hordeum vulgare]|nr:Alternative oxidase 1a, mitochondrial [Hordeum vulgare]
MKKKVAGRMKPTTPLTPPLSLLPEAPEESQFVALATDAQMVFDLMPVSEYFNDDTYLSTMVVGSNNSHWSQTNEEHQDDHEYELDDDGGGMVDKPRGRACNYTMDKYNLLCNTSLNVSMDGTVGVTKLEIHIGIG